MNLQHRFWADYTARDFALLDRAALVAVLPVGAIEQHEPHLPLSVDTAIVNGVVAACLPAADSRRLPGYFSADDARGQTRRMAGHADPFGTNFDGDVVRNRCFGRSGGGAQTGDVERPWWADCSDGHRGT